MYVIKYKNINNIYCIKYIRKASLTRTVWYCTWIDRQQVKKKDQTVQIYIHAYIQYILYKWIYINELYNIGDMIPMYQRYIFKKI